MENIDEFEKNFQKSSNALNRSDPNIQANNDLKSIELGGLGVQFANDDFDKSEQNSNKNMEISSKRRGQIMRKSYSASNLLVDVKKIKGQEEKLRTTKVKNKANLIEERRNKHKSIMICLTLLHSALFVAMIALQFEVNLRFNIRSFLSGYFDFFNSEFNYMGENESYPESIFKNLITKIQKNSFWFIEKKYEIVTNVRVTQRVSKFDNYTSLNLRLQDKTYKKLEEKRIKNNYKFDPFSDFNENFEYNKDLPNGHKYQIKNTFLKKGGYMMYFNVSTLMGLTANTDKQTYYTKEYKEDPKIVSPRNDRLRQELIQNFKNFFTPTFTNLMIDFVVANHELGYYTSVIMQITFTNQGYYDYFHVETQNVNIFVISTDFIRTAIEILFALVTLFNLVHIFYYDFLYSKKLATIRDRDNFMIEMNKIKHVDENVGENNPHANAQNNLKHSDNNGIKSIIDTDQNKELKETNKLDKNINNLNGDIGSKPIKKARTLDKTIEERERHYEILVENWTWSDFFKSYYYLYYTSALDLIRNLALILSVVMIIKWLTYVVYIINNKQNIYQGFEFYNPVINFDFSDSLIEISMQFKQYIKIMAVTAIFVFLRLIKVCEPFFPTLTVYITGFRKSLSDILSFFMLFFLIIFGISLILYFYFSVDIDSFNTLIQAFLNNIFFFIGSTDYDLVNQMFDKNSSFTILYFLFVGMFIKYAFNRILLAIILYNFEGLKYSKGKGYKCLPVSEFKSSVKPDLIYGLYCNLKKLPKTIIKFVCCKETKKKRKLKDVSKPKNKESKSSIQSEESFDLKDEVSNKNAAERDKNISEKSKRQGNLKQIKKSTSKISDNKEIVLDFSAEGEDRKIKNDEKNFNKNGHEHSLKSKKLNDSSLKGKSNEQIALTERILTLDDLRFVYSKYIENFEMISRNPYFDSPEDIERVNVYYEKKYEANFKKNIMYLILLLFLILSIFFNSNSPWRYGFSKLIDNNIYEKGHSSLSELNSMQLLDEFLIKNIPSMFSKSKKKEGNEYFILDSSYLIGNKFFFTKKRQATKINTTAEDLIRYYEPITIYKNFNFEDKRNVTIQSNLLLNQFVYDNNGMYSYANIGGLTGLLDINDFYKFLESGKVINDKISDGLENFTIFEFMIHNLELKIFAKYTIISILDYGYFFANSCNVDILSQDFGSNEFQIFRFIFIFVLFVLVFYETIEFIKELRQLNNSYNSWFVKRKIATSDQAKSVRKYLNSELIRKLKVIFDPIRASMFIILILIYIYIIMFLISVIQEGNFYSLFDQYSKNLKNLKSDDMNTKLINSDTKLLYMLKNQFTSISIFKDSYDKLSAFLLFFASLRIIFSLNMGKYFNAISQIAVKTLTKNLMIVLLLFLVLPSFIFFSYLVFGVIDTGYKSFINSILSNFLKLFDFRNDISYIIDNDIKILYIILFGFIMNLIILNLFVSIINNSYQKVKSKIFYSSENFSWIKIIFFCCNKKKIIGKTVGKEIIQNEIENFIKTHEAEPMLNLTAEFRNYQEFANYEIEKLKQVNESLSWIQNRTDLMQFSLICKDQNQISSSMTDNRFKNVDEDLMNLQYFAGLTYQTELVNSIEKDVLDIKESSHKLSVFLLSQKKRNVTNDEDFENEKMVKELIKLEKEYMDLISDIEELRKIKNEIDETYTYKKKDSNSDQENDD